MSKEWLKVETHVHTTESDGVRTPEEVLQIYDDNGYDAVAITDHDTFTKPETIPEDLIGIPCYEYTYANKLIPKFPFNFMYHILTLFIDEEVTENKDLNEVPFTSHAHPYTAWAGSIAARAPDFTDGKEMINGAIGCAVGPIGQAEHRITAGSDGHGKEFSPYTSAGTYVYAEPSRQGILDSLLENLSVAACLRADEFSENMFIANNSNIREKFEKDFGVSVMGTKEAMSYLPMQPVYASRYVLNGVEKGEEINNLIEDKLSQV